MRSSRISLLLIALLAIFALTLTACQKPPPEPTPPPAPEPKVEATPAPEPEPTPVPPDPEPIPDEPVVVTPTDEELAARLAGFTVYFEFDRYDLDDESRGKLQATAGVMKEVESLMVRVEGHCDERGTIEYNLALGQKRASVVRDYLAGLGIGAGRVQIISYGEEQPAAQGHSESAWSQNRRAEFKVN